MASERPIDLLMDVLPGLAKKGPGQFEARCPVHDDTHASLSVREFPDGSCSVKCFACGAKAEAVMKAIGLEPRDLFPRLKESQGGVKPARRKTGKFKRGGEWHDFQLDGYYPYTDEEGKELYRKNRWGSESQPKTFTVERKLANGNTVSGLDGGWHEWTGGKKGWQPLKLYDRDWPPSADALKHQWLEAPRRVLYGLHLLHLAGADEVPYLVEGEKDVAPARREFGLATTTVSGAEDWYSEYEDQLSKFRTVVVVADRDRAGLESALMKVARLTATGTECVVAWASKGKDVWACYYESEPPGELVAIDPGEELARLEEERPELKVVEGGRPEPQATGTDGRQAEPRKGADWFPYSDLENAEMFASREKDELRYCAAFGCWLRWTGSMWAEDETGGEPVLGKWRDLAGELDRKATTKDQSKHAQYCKTGKSYSALVQFAKIFTPFPIAPGMLDQETDFLPVQNGVIDLRSGQLRAHDRRLLYTRAAPVAFDPEADCPKWVEFLLQSVNGDKEQFVYLQTMAGLLLSGDIRAEAVFMLYGPAGTGKSQFINAMRALLGPYAVELDKNHLMKKRFENDRTEHWARLKGARMVTAIEVGASDRFDEEKVKTISGEERITARRMRENSFDFWPQFKLVMTGNHRPDVRDAGNSFWRRLKCIRFDNVVDESRRIEGIGKAIARDELPGILNWAVEGAVRYYSEGLRDTVAVRAEVAQYREAVDVVGRFLTDETVAEDGERVSMGAVHERYMKWAKTNGEYPLSLKVLALDFEARGLPRHRLSSGVHVLGLRLRPWLEGES